MAFDYNSYPFNIPTTDDYWVEENACKDGPVCGDWGGVDSLSDNQAQEYMTNGNVILWSIEENRIAGSTTFHGPWFDSNNPPSNEEIHEYLTTDMPTMPLQSNRNAGSIVLERLTSIATNARWSDGTEGGKCGVVRYTLVFSGASGRWKVNAPWIVDVYRFIDCYSGGVTCSVSIPDQECMKTNTTNELSINTTIVNNYDYMIARTLWILGDTNTLHKVIIAVDGNSTHNQEILVPVEMGTEHIYVESYFDACTGHDDSLIKNCEQYCATLGCLRSNFGVPSGECYRPGDHFTLCFTFVPYDPDCDPQSNMDYIKVGLVYSGDTNAYGPDHVKINVKTHTGCIQISVGSEGGTLNIKPADTHQECEDNAGGFDVDICIDESEEIPPGEEFPPGSGPGDGPDGPIPGAGDCCAYMPKDFLTWQYGEGVRNLGPFKGGR